MIIVEDGDIVAGANSYVSLADARTRAEVLGVTISGTDEDANSQLVQAAYYNDSMYAVCFTGQRVELTQPMQWPRDNAYIYDSTFPNDEIPQQVIDAQIFTASAINAGVDLYPNNDGKSVASKTVGSISVSYFNNGTTGTNITITSTQNAIGPVLSNCSGKYSYQAYS